MNSIRRRCLTTVPALLAATLLAFPAQSEDGRTAVAVTNHFAFYSDFDTNLHDALIVAGSAQSSNAARLFDREPQKTCFEGLPMSAQLGWNLAVDYYAKVIYPGGWMRRPQFTLRQALARLPGLTDDQRTTQFLSISRSFRTAAAPAYRDCYWGARDEDNRRWIQQMLDRLEGREAPIAKRLAGLYGVDWHGLPLAVDVVEHAPPVGANTVVLEPGGHILVATSNANLHGLEIVFHEASHTLASEWRGDPLPTALASAAEETDTELPRDLWHVVLFFMTGEAVSDFLARAGHSDYETYMEVNGLWEGRWGRYREPVEAVWPKYMTGQTSLEEAALALMRELGAQAETR